MRRRTFVRAIAAGGTMLARPAVSASPKVLRFVPTSDLAILDPIWTTGRVTRNHGFMVFDTLYAVTSDWRFVPQMAAGHTVEDDGLRWKITLRDGLRFHDGSAVRSRDVIASIRRFAARDGFGAELLGVCDDIETSGDSAIVFRLKRPFPRLPQALSGGTAAPAFIMPEWIAATDPFRQVNEIIGSGPYRYVANERVAGARNVYERFAEYVPRDEPSDWMAGGKRTYFDRIEWTTMGDGATAANALKKGEIDWLEVPPLDLLDWLRRDNGLRVLSGFSRFGVGVLRFNHLYPPFNDVNVRRAVLAEINQADLMRGCVGEDRDKWRDGIGLYPPGVPFATDAGAAAIAGARDNGAVRRALAAAGWGGKPVVVLDAVESPVLRPLTAGVVWQLRQMGFEVDDVGMAVGEMYRRRTLTKPPEDGGWHVFVSVLEASVIANMGANPAIRGNGRSAWEGWPRSDALEDGWKTWIAAGDTETRRAADARMQSLLFSEVPYVPLGAYLLGGCHSARIGGIAEGLPLFWGVRPV